jgi:type II secretory pathway predicted ATPase ExeA
MEAPSPFRLCASPEAYVPREASERCLGELEAFAQGGEPRVALLFGPSGMGKTLLLRVLAARLEGRLRSVYVPNPIFAPRELCLWALEALKVPREGDPEAALLRTAESLRREGGGLLLLVDDVELLPTRTQAWIFAVARRAGGALRAVLAGVDADRRDQLLECAVGGLQLVRLEEPMSAPESAALVRAELERSGAAPEVCARFDEAGLAEIHRRSRGLPIHVQNEAAAIAGGAPAGEERGLSLGARIVSVGHAPPVESPRPPARRPRTLETLRAVVAAPASARRPRLRDSMTFRLACAFAAGIAVAVGFETWTGEVAPRPETQAAAAAPPDSEAAVAAPPPVAARTPREPAPKPAAPEPARAAPETAPPERVARAPVSRPAARPPPKPAPAAPAAREKPPAPPPEPARPVAAASLLVSINARPWATIWIDGEPVGETPLAELPLAPGPHRFAAHLPDGRIVEREVEIGPESRHLRFE